MTAKRTGPATTAPPADLNEALAAAEKIAASLLTQIKTLRTSDELREDPTNALRLVQSARDNVNRLNALAAAFNSFQSGLRDAAERQFLEVESSVRSVLEGRRWRVDGQWPTLYVERAIALEFDERSRSVSVAGKPLPNLRPNAIASTLEPLVGALIPKGFSSRAFLGQLEAAYQENQPRAAQVAVLDVYRSMVIRSQRPQFWRDARSTSFTPLTVDQFRARLSRTLEEGVTNTSGGRVLRLLPPLDPKDGFFLYQPAEQRFGYVGRIEFVLPLEKNV